MGGEALSPKTVNNHLGVLSMLFKKAIDWNYCEANPMSGVGLLRAPVPEFDFWTQEQSDAFLDAILRHRPDWHPFFLCALRTGMRLGELLALTWGDVDFTTHRITLRRSYSHGALTTPKNGRTRTIPMTPELETALLEHRHLKSDLVFCDRDGGYMDRNNVKSRFWLGIRAAGVTLIRIHDMRHSTASQLVMKGVPLKAVQELLGHATIEMTMRYAHLAPGAQADYVGLLDGDSNARNPDEKRRK